MRRNLIEQLAELGSSDIRVDRDAGVIFNARILGRFSKNRYEPNTVGTEYSARCMNEAVLLYEGSKVNIDHPSKVRGQLADRSARDGFGSLKNVRFVNDALIGDLHYLKSHPLAEAVVEDVERKLGMYGLSHNATSGAERIDRKSKKLVIEKIVSVRSVDLVRDPATNRNLWESLMPSVTFRAILEGLSSKFDSEKQAKVRELLELDGMGDLPVGEQAPDETDPDQALMNGFKSAIEAVVSQYESGDLDAAGAVDKIKKLLMTHEDLAGNGSEGDDEDEDEDDTKVTESVQERLTELDVRRLCESAQYTPKPAVLKALMALPDDASRRQLIESVKQPAGTPGLRKPRSGTPPQPAAPNVADAFRVLRS